MNSTVLVVTDSVWVKPQEFCSYTSVRAWSSIFTLHNTWICSHTTTVNTSSEFSEQTWAVTKYSIILTSKALMGWQAHFPGLLFATVWSCDSLHMHECWGRNAGCSLHSRACSSPRPLAQTELQEKVWSNPHLHTHPITTGCSHATNTNRCFKQTFSLGGLQEAAGSQPSTQKGAENTP